VVLEDQKDLKTLILDLKVGMVKTASSTVKPLVAVVVVVLLFHLHHKLDVMVDHLAAAVAVVAQVHQLETQLVDQLLTVLVEMVPEVPEYPEVQVQIGPVVEAVVPDLTLGAPVNQRRNQVLEMVVMV